RRPSHLPAPRTGGAIPRRRPASERAALRRSRPPERPQPAARSALSWTYHQLPEGHGNSDERLTDSSVSERSRPHGVKNPPATPLDSGLPVCILKNHYWVTMGRGMSLKFGI